METFKAKALRNKYGIRDSRNEYTEEQILDLSQRKLYYIKPCENHETGDIHIQHKQVSGYVSVDGCIFIKDGDLTKRDDINYYPIKNVRNCMKIKDGIYHDELDGIIYCTVEELQYCLDYAKQYTIKEIDEQVKELEQELLKLKNTKVI